jgi:hypothetical protein
MEVGVHSLGPVAEGAKQFLLLGRGKVFIDVHQDFAGHGLTLHE